MECAPGEEAQVDFGEGAKVVTSEGKRRRITTNVWNYENQRTAVLLPSGSRETMSYNANLRNVRTET